MSTIDTTEPNPLISRSRSELAQFVESPRTDSPIWNTEFRNRLLFKLTIDMLHEKEPKIRIKYAEILERMTSPNPNSKPKPKKDQIRQLEELAASLLNQEKNTLDITPKESPPCQPDT